MSDWWCSKATAFADLMTTSFDFAFDEFEYGTYRHLGIYLCFTEWVLTRQNVFVIDQVIAITWVSFCEDVQIHVGVSSMNQNVMSVYCLPLLCLV